MAWSKQGEHNVPKRYLKNTEWTKNGPLGTGYYIGDPDDKSKNQNIIPVDFNFKALQDLHTRKTTILSLKDQHQFNTDSESLMKKEPQIEAIGAPLMEHQMKKSLWVILEETPLTQTSQSLLIHNLKTRNSNLLPSPNSSLLTSANHPPYLTCWLEQWHKLQPQQPSPPTAWWPKPWELVYPKRNYLKCQRNPPDHIPLTIQLRKWKWRWSFWT